MGSGVLTIQTEGDEAAAHDSPTTSSASAILKIHGQRVCVPICALITQLKSCATGCIPGARIARPIQSVVAIRSGRGEISLL